MRLLLLTIDAAPEVFRGDERLDQVHDDVMRLSMAYRLGDPREPRNKLSFPRRRKSMCLILLDPGLRRDDEGGVFQSFFRSISLILDMMCSARALERIGDRCRNTYEYIIYFVKGKDVRDVGLDLMHKEIFQSERPL